MPFFPLNPVTTAVSLTCALACGSVGSQGFSVNVKKRGEPEVRSYTLKDQASPATRTVSLAVTSPRGRVSYGNVSSAVLGNAESLDMLPNEQHLFSTMVNEAASLRAQAQALRAEIRPEVGDSRAKAGWSALTDGASTLGVLAAGGVEFNPLMPTSPLGIAAVTAAKIYGATALIDDLEPAEKERIRRLSSAGWTGATVANVAALAGLFPATAIPLGAAAGLLQYSAGADEAEKAQKQQQLAELEARVDTLVATAQSYRTQALVAAHQRKADRLYVRPVVQEVLVASAENAVVFDQIKKPSAQAGALIVRQSDQYTTKDPRFNNVGSVYIYTEEEVQQHVASDKLSAEKAALVQQQLQAGLSQRQPTPVAAPVVAVPMGVPAAARPGRPVRAEPGADLPPVSISTPYGVYTPHPAKRAAMLRAGLLPASLPVGLAGNAPAQPVGFAAGVPASSGTAPAEPSAPLAKVTPLPRGGIQVSDLNATSVPPLVAQPAVQSAEPAISVAAPVVATETESSKPVMVATVLNAPAAPGAPSAKVAEDTPEAVVAKGPQADQTTQAPQVALTVPSSLRVGRDTYERAMAFVRGVAGPRVQDQSSAEVPAQPVVQQAVMVPRPVPPSLENPVEAAVTAKTPAAATTAAPVSRLVRETLALPAKEMVPADAVANDSEDLAQQMPAPERAATGAVQQFSEADAMQLNFALGRPVAVDPNAVSPLAPVFNLPSRRVPTIKALASDPVNAAAELEQIPRQYDFDKKSIPRYLQAKPAPQSPVVSYWD